ncbi:MAG: DUF302 domain-containing protein [Arenicella sp.]|nr:DUF302 domain-containing protein [Arenicella sp.]
MKRTLLSILYSMLLLFSIPSFAGDHLIKVESQHSVKDTADKFIQLVDDKGLRFFSRIDHAANAADVGLQLTPTEVILFGNPKVGTKLMLCAPTVAIDLPQKALIWEADNGTVWLAYSNPAFIKERHSIEACDAILEKITSLLAGLAAAATD